MYLWGFHFSTSSFLLAPSSDTIMHACVVNFFIHYALIVFNLCINWRIYTSIWVSRLSKCIYNYIVRYVQKKKYNNKTVHRHTYTQCAWCIDIFNGNVHHHQTLVSCCAVGYALPIRYEQLHLYGSPLHISLVLLPENGRKLPKRMASEHTQKQQIGRMEYQRNRQYYVQYQSGHWQF